MTVSTHPFTLASDRKLSDREWCQVCGATALDVELELASRGGVLFLGGGVSFRCAIYKRERFIDYLTETLCPYCWAWADPETLDARIEWRRARNELDGAKAYIEEHRP